MQNGKIIAICNQKGGVTKTTTTVNLGVGLARLGKGVLLVDGDPQGDLTTALGWLEYADTDDKKLVTLSTLMYQVMNDEPVEYVGCLLKHREGVDLIPANLNLAGLEMSLVSVMGSDFVLRKLLSPLRQHYDYILIDCMPSLGKVTINALTAADSVIIPVQTQYLPAVGMTQLVSTVQKVRRDLNPSLAIDGVLLTLVAPATNLAKKVAETLQEKYGTFIRIYAAQIPISVRAAETSSVGESIYLYDSGNKVACAYERFTQEVVSHA